MDNVTESRLLLDPSSSSTLPPAPASVSDDYDYYHSNHSIPDDCPRFTEEDINLIDGLAYWVEGVIQTSLAVTGLFFNIVSRKVSN